MSPDHPSPAVQGSAAAASEDQGTTAATYCSTLVDEWVSLGVTDAVLCPGSRNTAVSVALVADGRIRTQVVHDERSAAFMALGLALSTGRPAVLTCTSGSAATHFHPAVVEADAAAVPLLVVTADRPPELQGVLAPQTINQRDLYGRAVRWFCEPGPPTGGGSPWWRDLARDALARTCGEVPGPVHLNLAFREPLTGVAGDLPATRSDMPVFAGFDRVTPWDITDEDVARLVPAISNRRGVITAGSRACRSGAEQRALLEFAEALGWPIFADAPSGMRVPSEPVVGHFEAVLRSGAFDDSPPEVVIRLGALLSSKATNQWLARSGALQLAVDRHGLCPDPDAVLSQCFTAVPAAVLGRLAALDPGPAPGQWTQRWNEIRRVGGEAVASAVDAASPGAISEPAAARAVMASVPGSGSLLVASSMPVRDLEGFAAPRDGVKVYANRGTNGIDGTIATATGIALGSGGHTMVLCGDVAFLHDIGSLNGLARRTRARQGPGGHTAGSDRVDMTIVVIDNNGGGIFHFLTQHDQLDEVTFETVFGTPHDQDLAAVATGFGLDVEVVASGGGLTAALTGAVTRGGVKVVIVRSDRHHNLDVHRSIQQIVTDALTAPSRARQVRST